MMNNFEQDGKRRLRCLFLLVLFAVVNVQRSVGQKLKLIKNASDKGAVCLDGTLPGYYFSPGFGDGTSNWIVYFEGGGWCKDDRSCALRAKTYLGSTSIFGTRPILPDTGLLSNDPSTNPEFYNWNVAWIRYCDGASFLGDKDEPVLFRDQTIYYRGKRVWNVVMEELMAIGMETADKALITGCSAGGLTAILHCDNFKALFPSKTSAKCLADAGFFLDVPDIAGGRTSLEMFRGTALTQNVMSSLDADCTASKAPSQKWECILAQNALPFVQAPLYILQAGVDYWQIQNLVAPKSADPSGEWQACAKDTGSCTLEQVQMLQDFMNTMVKSLEKINPSNHGKFVISCYAHCMSTDSNRWNSGQTYLINDKTMAQSIGEWFSDRDTPDKFLVDKPYPSNPTC